MDTPKRLLVSLAITTVTLCASASAARAQEARGMGVGATSTLAGADGATFVYDASKFHIVGLLGLVSVDRDPGEDLSGLLFGGQFLYHIHDGASSDFSLGGGLSIVTANEGNQDETNIHLEGLAQIRVFITTNVALSASLGLLIATGDNFLIIGDNAIFGSPGGTSVSAIVVGGQVNGALGLTYFFR